ncbi:Mpv17-like protein 2 [Trachymyrmex cornetzi]|uniref:Mpv17-like protein 2 n=1 Tax=Trachymyrmex cornetzi TaxID=471704 RepID=A0A195DDX7_9HYME|nr:Mpv17-like protein 2 [Trachymyrmex cornetzi]
MGVLRQLLFGKYLLVTNTVSCGLMMAAGDVIQQRSEHWKKHCSHKYFPSSVMAASPEDEKVTISSTYGHDYMRTRNMMIVGLLQGPFHHWFYMLLDKILPGRNAKSVLKKTFLDQSIASPTCLTIFFVDCCFWPPTQCINFFFVPLHYRVLYINAMTMVYDIFLSYMKYVSFTCIFIKLQSNKYKLLLFKL